MNFKKDFTKLLGQPVNAAKTKHLLPVLANYGKVQRWLVGKTDGGELLDLLRLEYQNSGRLSIMMRIYTRENQLRFHEEKEALWEGSQEVPRGRRTATG